MMSRDVTDKIEFCDEAVFAAKYLAGLNRQFIEDPSKLTKAAIKQQENDTAEMIQNHIDEKGLGFALFSAFGNIEIKEDPSATEWSMANNLKETSFGCTAMYIDSGLVQANTSGESVTVYDAETIPVEIYEGEKCEA